ncbi:hypothetical protein [Pseudomonas guariconensis]|uniref:hypothetical protein n=1 Tax=Pseudomonas guariconensis TaxID=1288410 RepID=UPI0018ABC185|nr:hypothetical protein [Pseudomonas guariconensis]MBF8755501.1 hypothetical protein [Pseudomonas guariconensis]
MIVGFMTPISWPGDRKYEDTAETPISAEMLGRAKQSPRSSYYCTGEGNPLSLLTKKFRQAFADADYARGIIFMATEFSYLAKGERSDSIDYVFVEDARESIEKARSQLKAKYDFVACESDQSYLSKAMHQLMRSLAIKK